MYGHSSRVGGTRILVVSSICSLTINRKNPQVFKINIFTLNITNKSYGFFSKNASFSFLNVFVIMERKSKTPEGLTLKWFDPDIDIPKNIDQIITGAEFTD